jgi:hypothetical protein
MTEEQLVEIATRVESSRHTMTDERIKGLALAALLEDYADAERLVDEQVWSDLVFALIDRLQGERLESERADAIERNLPLLSSLVPGDRIVLPSGEELRCSYSGRLLEGGRDDEGYAKYLNIREWRGIIEAAIRGGAVVIKAVAE